MKTVNGVITTSSTVLSNTCDSPTFVSLPGGMFGPSTKIMIGSRTIVPITVSTAIRRACDALDHIHEPVHVADRLHRTAEAVDEAGRAGHEALPAVVALLAGVERERDRLVRHRLV